MNTRRSRKRNLLYLIVLLLSVNDRSAARGRGGAEAAFCRQIE